LTKPFLIRNSDFERNDDGDVQVGDSPATNGESESGEQSGLSWDKIHGIMDGAVERGLSRLEAEPLPRLEVDEKAFRKGRACSAHRVPSH
jgi:hypothetical protein